MFWCEGGSNALRIKTSIIIVKLAAPWWWIFLTEVQLSRRHTGFIWVCKKVRSADNCRTVWLAQQLLCRSCHANTANPSRHSSSGEANPIQQDYLSWGRRLAAVVWFLSRASFCCCPAPPADPVFTPAVYFSQDFSEPRPLRALTRRSSSVRFDSWLRSRELKLISLIHTRLFLFHSNPVHF